MKKKLVLVLTAVTLAAACAQAAQKPNILFIAIGELDVLVK